MGLNRDTNSGKFLGVTNGRISLRVPEGTDGAKERKITQGKNEGKSVYEVFFNSVDGYIVGGEVKRKEIGGLVIESIVIKFQDGDEIFNLNLPWNSSLRDSFCKSAPNIDVSKTVEVTIFPSTRKGEEGKPVMIIEQEGERVGWHYTRDNPNGLPQPSKKNVKGKETWDFSEVEDFLWSKTEEFFEQFEGDEKPSYQEASEDKEEFASVEESGSSDVDEDLPF